MVLDQRVTDGYFLPCTIKIERDQNRTTSLTYWPQPLAEIVLIDLCMGNFN